MALIKETVEDKIEIVGDYKAIQVRTATVIKEDGTEINRTFHRHLLECCIRNYATGVWSDTDVSGESTEVQGIASVVWTDAIKTSYKAHMDATYPHIDPESESE